MFLKPQIIIIACFTVFLSLFPMACSDKHSTTPPAIQESTLDKTHEANVAVTKNERSNCSDSNEYSFPVVENPDRIEVANTPMPKDLEIRVGADLVAKIELPVADWEVKNFSLMSTRRTKNGFDAMVEWGGGNYHYEIQFSFMCKKKELHLYKVIHNNFSTTEPNNGNFWNKKEVKKIDVEPIVSIDKFVMLDYLN